MNTQLMLGNEAVARGAWEAGCRVTASYPGTPSTEITEFCAKYPEMNCEWATNEKVACEVAFGAAATGARAMTCMKHVGVNVAADPIFTAAYTGVDAGLVIVCADDPAMHSSQNEQDSRMYARAAHIPMLEPADSEECRTFAKLAFELSEQYDTPVFLRLTTRLSHSRSPVTLGNRVEHDVGKYQKDFMKYVMMPGMAIKRHVVVEAREKKLAEDARALFCNRVELRDVALGVVCAGVTYQYVREALPNASVLKLGMSYPLPEDLIREFSAKVDRLVVIEELEGVLQRDIAALGIPVSGKEKTGVQGELSVEKIRALFAGGEPPKAPEALPARPPVLCPGCPHRATFRAIKDLKLTVFGDIGCYTLAALPPVSSMDMCLCMGASVGMAFGAEKARGKEFSRHAVAVLGDSTFLHSGVTSLIDAVYNGATITIVILDNRITGMTGHQQNPASGKDIYGNPAPMLDLAALCGSVGAHVRVVDPMDIKETTRVLREETARESVSVVIAKSPCALLSKEKKPPLAVSGCKGCGACLKLGCPAIRKEGGLAVIDGALCAGCGLCVSVCPFGAIGGADA